MTVTDSKFAEPASRSDPLVSYRERFPYRIVDGMSEAEQVAIHQARGKVLEQVEDLLYHRTRRAFPWMQAADVEDLVSDLRLHLFQKTLPAFDAGRNTKPVTLIWRATDNYLAQHRAKLARQTKREGEVQEFQEYLVPTSGLDGQVYRFAEEFLEDPKDLLTPRQIQILRGLQALGPDDQKQDLARRLNISPSTLSESLRRIRERLEQVDPEGFDQFPKPEHAKTGPAPKPRSHPRDRYENLLQLNLDELTAERMTVLEQHLTPRQHEVLRVVLTHVCLTQAALAEKLGYGCCHVMESFLRRIRRSVFEVYPELQEISIQEADDGVEVEPDGGVR